jgi:hypothetical protein
MIFGSDPHGFKDVWWDAETLYLYDDGERSRLDYFERLGRLLARNIETPGRDEHDF